MKLIGKVISLKEIADLTESEYFHSSFSKPPYDWRTKSERSQQSGFELAILSEVIVHRVFGLYSITASAHIADMTYEGYLDTFKETYSWSDDVLSVENDRSTVAIEEPVFIIGGHNNYYHWLLNWYPRIVCLKIFAERLAIPFSTLRFLVAAEVPKSFLELLYFDGISESQMIFAKNENYHLRYAFVPNFFDKHCYYPDVLRWLNAIPERIERRASKSQHIYVDRNNLVSSRRKVFNNNEFKCALKLIGVESVFLDQISIKEQVSIFRNAEVIVGAHGAGLANIVFCSPKASLVLFEYKHVSEYEELARLLGISVYKLPTVQVIESAATETRLKDFFVDIELVISLIRSIKLKLPALI